MTIESASTVLRPRPVMTKDTSFFWEAAAEGRLVIQRCKACRRLRHPPMPACPHCRSLEWDTIDSEGRGTLVTFTVVHRPVVPPFKAPYVVGVVALAEGTRLVAELVGVEAPQVSIGMPLVVDFLRDGDSLTLPVFRPAAEPRP